MYMALLVAIFFLVQVLEVTVTGTGTYETYETRTATATATNFDSKTQAPPKQNHERKTQTLFLQEEDHEVQQGICCAQEGSHRRRGPGRFEKQEERKSYWERRLPSALQLAGMVCKPACICRPIQMLDVNGNVESCVRTQVLILLEVVFFQSTATLKIK